MLKKSTALALSFLLLFSGCSSSTPPEATSSPIPDVRVEMTKRSIMNPEIKLSGSVTAQEEITIASEVMGTVSHVFKKEGQTVKPGELIMKLGTGDNMLSISYASAQRAMANASKLLSLTAQVGAKQVKNAEIAVERAKITLKQLEDTKKLNITAQKAQTETTKSSFEIAQKGLELAQKALEDAKTNEAKTHANLIENNANAVANALIPMTSALNFVDTLIGISDVHKTDNDDIEVYLWGNTPHNTKQNVLDKWRTIEPQIDEIKAQYAAINKKTYTEADESAVLQTLNAVSDMLKETRTVLRSADEVLQYSFVTPQFSQAKLDGYKGQVQGYLQSIEGSIATLTAQEQSLTNFKIQSPQRILDAQINVSVAESKVASANQGMTSAQSAEGSTNINLDANISQARNAVDAAQAALEMAKVQAGVSEQNAVAQLSSAQSSVDSASFSLSKLSIESQIAGTISKILKKDGDTIQAGTPLVIVSNVNALKLVSDVSVEESLQLRLGMPAKITINGVNQEFVGVLTLVHPEADKVTRRVKVEITIPNIKNIPTNTFATATLTLQNQKAEIYVPMTTLVSQNPPSVMIVEKNAEGKNVMKKITVELGQQINGIVAITKGLRPNQMLVSEVYPTLFDGDEVNPIEQQSSISAPSVSIENLISPHPTQNNQNTVPQDSARVEESVDPMQQLWNQKKAL